MHEIEISRIMSDNKIHGLHSWDFPLRILEQDIVLIHLKKVIGRITNEE